MEFTKEISDDTPISGKYKTIGQVKNIPIKSAILVISRMKPSEERKYLCKWLFETHYLKKKFTRNLTNRIKNISNKSCYNHIISHCFDGIDPREVYETIPILNEYCKNIINLLHAIDSSGTGIFMDYLIRRVINEIRQEKFQDSRAGSVLGTNSIPHFKMGTSEMFLKQPGHQTIQCKHCKEYFPQNCNPIEKSYRHLETCCRYQSPTKSLAFKTIYEIPSSDGGWSFGEVTKYINKDDDNHYCETGCKNKMEQSCWCDGSEPNECVFPLCQNMCYMKVQNTEKYETKDILKELYIVSCCHSEAFGQCPSQDKFDKIIDILDKVNPFDFIFPLNKMCNSLLFNSKKILLNPVLYGNDTPIPADCDVVIDDTLIDIKCTGGNNDISEMLQLLGYASLLKYNMKYNMRMNNICIINLLQGECNIYNIEKILDCNLLDYLDLLTNKYNPNKKINIKSIDNKNIKYPLFVNNLKINYNDSKIMEQIDISHTVYENKMEQIYPGYKNMGRRQRKNCCPIFII